MAAATLPVAAVPHAAADEGAAGLSFTLRTALSQFPCPGDGESQSCTATVTEASVSGRLAGAEDRAWEATIADAELTGTFAYADDPVLPCGVGRGAGAVTVVADDVHVFGTYQDAPLPRLVSGLTATFRLEWERAGTSLKLAVRDAVVTLDVVGLGSVEVVSTGQGEGSGDFVVDQGGLSGCVDGDEAGGTTAVVSGRVSLFEDRLPSVPALLAPDAGPYDFGQPEVFRVNAVDPDGDPYRAVVTVWDAATGEVVARFETRLVPSGVDSTGRPFTPLLPGSYAWTAESVDIRGGRSAAASPRNLLVGPGALAPVLA